MPVSLDGKACNVSGKEDAMFEKQNHCREPYVKPELSVHDNLREITFECPQWQCSVTVPPPPPVG